MVSKKAAVDFSPAALFDLRLSTGLLRRSAATASCACRLFAAGRADDRLWRFGRTAAASRERESVVRWPVLHEARVGLSGWPVRYCCPALPQYLPAFSVALWLMVSSACIARRSGSSPRTATGRCCPG